MKPMISRYISWIIAAFFAGFFFGFMITVVIPDNAWAPLRVGVLAGLIAAAVVTFVGGLIVLVESSV